MEGCAFFCDCWGDTPRSGVNGRFSRWRPPFWLMASMFRSFVPDGVGGGVVCHGFLSRLRVLRVPWDILILVESVVLPTDPLPGSQWDAAILVTCGWRCIILISKHSGSPARVWRVSCARDGLHSWSCTHFLGGNSSINDGCRLFVALVCLMSLPHVP